MAATAGKKPQNKAKYKKMLKNAHKNISIIQNHQSTQNFDNNHNTL